MPDHPLTLLLDFDQQVLRDQHQAAAFLHRRDRRFALETGAPLTPARWLEHLQRINGPAADASQRPLRRWRRITLGFVLIGAVFGVLTMIGLLYYDGSGRINITLLLAFMLLQLLLALITAGQSLLGFRPWGWLIQRYSGRREDRPSVLGQLQPQLLAQAAQTGGLVFAITGLLTLLVLVVVQDLAFGWSTTLSTGADAYHRLVHALAWPWHTFWPAAVPDPELVGQTRFYRINSASQAAAVHWGAWWPFVTAAWCSYVIVPRLLLGLLAGLHLRYCARRLLQSHPGLLALQYRMETPLLETGNQTADTNSPPELSTRAALKVVPDAPVVVRWAGAGDDGLPGRLCAGDERLLLMAGGAATLAQDYDTLQQASQRLNSVHPHAVTILTRAWEPPTAELEDFLTQAREHWPANVRITLVPLATDADAAPGDNQLAQWLRFSERLADLRLQVGLAPTDDEPSRGHG